MINRKKNVNIQVTFSKEDAEQLEALKNAFNNEGIKVSKSDILAKALREYIKMIVYCGAKANRKAEDKVEEPQGEKQDA